MLIQHICRPLAIKALTDEGIFTGYASVFDKIDNHGEAVKAGAFKRTLGHWRLQGRMPALLWMHDPTMPVGVWQSLHEDNNGLAVQGKLALRTQKGAEAYELLKLGAVTGMSIGYRVIASQIDAMRKTRLLTDIDLFEISLVSFPANEAARVHNVKAPQSRRHQADDAKRAVVARLHRAARILQEPPKSLLRGVNKNAGE